MFMFVSCGFALGSLLCVCYFVDVSSFLLRKRACNWYSSSPISKRTWHSSQASNSERFRIPLDSQTYSSFFEDAPTKVERVVKFDTLRTTFIPRIFEEQGWANLFENFEDAIDELVKEFYSNARYTKVELKCWVRGKEFSINPDYIAKVLRITRSANADFTPYDDKQPQVQDIL